MGNWKHWYDKRRWAKLAQHQLREEPLCCFCLKRGLVVPATVADHIEPHKGNERKFWFGKLQSLCSTCHGSIKQQIEVSGFSKEIGNDGWPVDRKHPVYRS